MEENANLLDPKQAWVPLDGNWDLIPQQIEEIGEIKCVLVIDTKNWHYFIQEKDFSGDYKYPKKRRDIKDYETFKTEWLELKDAIQRVKEWKENEFSHSIQSDLHPYWLNGIFEYIRLDGQSRGWLWCGTDNKSYCPELLRDLVLFPNEIDAFIEVAKQNTEKELKKKDEEGNGLLGANTDENSPQD